jgi:hypothetical protein
MKGEMYRCPWWKECDENPEMDCAQVKFIEHPCIHKMPHKHTDNCGGGGILPDCETLNKGTSRIPVGYYCHQKNDFNNICPYWSMDKTKPAQENGYCSYLEKGDWDFNAEVADMDVEVSTRNHDGTYITTIMKYRDLPPTSLLWDKCKECGIKINTTYDKIEFVSFIVSDFLSKIRRKVARFC